MRSVSRRATRVSSARHRAPMASCWRVRSKAARSTCRRNIDGNDVRLALALLLVAASATAAAPPAPLQFRISEGRVLNAFYQQGPVSAHLLLSSGTQPRVLVAFPAGNSGVGVWFETTQTPVRWTLDAMKGVSRSDERGRALHGIEADASVDAGLVVRDAVLSSVRVLRDYQINGAY